MNYSRISGAVNVEMLKSAHIVGVGAGGAYCLYESLVRSGVGKLTVIDFDTVDDVNLCRQGFYPSQVGMKKVDALKEHLLKINPNLDYNGIDDNLLTMDLSQLQSVIKSADLLLFMTDNFKAQAFGNNLALTFRKPAIWGGYYEKSQCVEIVFYIPEVTPGCFRCAVAPRYVIQEEEPVSISSACNTMFHSQFIDSVLGMLSMAILHNNIKGYEFSEYFGEEWNQNLIQIKVSPEYESPVFDTLIAKTDATAILFDALWFPVEKKAECPDCK